MSKKTAIQQAIEEVELYKKHDIVAKGGAIDPELIKYYKATIINYSNIIILLQSLLPAEQLQIEEAFAEGRQDNGYGQGGVIIPYTYEDSADYYDQTFTTKTTQDEAQRTKTAK